MNTSTSEVLWPSPVAAHENAQHIADTQPTLMALVATDILVAVSSGLFTAAVSLGSATSVDTQYVTLLLNQAGYTCSNDGTNLNVSW